MTINLLLLLSFILLSHVDFILNSEEITNKIIDENDYLTVEILALDFLIDNNCSYYMKKLNTKHENPKSHKEGQKMKCLGETECTSCREETLDIKQLPSGIYRLWVVETSTNKEFAHRELFLKYHNNIPTVKYTIKTLSHTPSVCGYILTCSISGSRIYDVAYDNSIANKKIISEDIYSRDTLDYRDINFTLPNLNHYQFSINLTTPEDNILRSTTIVNYHSEYNPEIPPKTYFLFEEYDIILVVIFVAFTILIIVLTVLIVIEYQYAKRAINF